MRELHKFEAMVDFFDHRRIPVSALERKKIQGEHPYYGAQGVIDYINDYIFDGEYVLIAEDGANLITRNQPIAQIANGQFWVNNHAHIVRAKEGVSTNYFVNMLINSMNLTGYVTGAAQPKLSQKNLRIVEVNIPSFTEQVQITSVLSAYDALIENNRRRIQLLERAARLLYKEWFVHLRFPSHEHVNIKDGVPEGWERKLLGEFAPLNYGKALKKDHRIPGPFPVFGSSGIVGTHEKSLVPGPAIIVGRKGNVGSVHWSKDDFYPIDTVYFIEAKHCSIYLYYALLHTQFINTDVAVPGLNRDFAHSRLLLVPDNKILALFEQHATTIYAQINRLEKYNQTLVKAHALLLPRLINGEADVRGE